jgi:NhaP-type Na+/H+ or K+/H+ antiporter
MLICSIFVSSDIIAAMSILKFHEYPNIFSIVLGEGLFNDVVVIILYKSVKLFQDVSPQPEFDVATGFKLIGDFIALCCLSVSIGVISGFLCTIMLKKFRFVC